MSSNATILKAFKVQFLTVSYFKNRIKIYSNGNTKQKNTVSDKTLDTILDIIEENQSTNYSDETKRKSCWKWKNLFQLERSSKNEPILP